MHLSLSWLQSKGQGWMQHRCLSLLCSYGGSPGLLSLEISQQQARTLDLHPAGQSCSGHCRVPQAGHRFSGHSCIPIHLQWSLTYRTYLVGTVTSPATKRFPKAYHRLTYSSSRISTKTNQKSPVNCGGLENSWFWGIQIPFQHSLKVLMCHADAAGALLSYSKSYCRCIQDKRHRLILLCCSQHWDAGQSVWQKEWKQEQPDSLT